MNDENVTREASAPRTCPRCGAALLVGAPPGICPQCELRGALDLFAGGGHATQSAETVLLAKPVEEDDGKLPRFGDYELLEEIARGGMGVVYKARQVSLDRLVAVKVLLFGPMASKEYLARFRAEAATAASLQHPNIVAIHEVGVHQGQQFIAMDYVAGPTLSKVCAGQPLPPRRAAAYVKTIAEAIHYAHERGILHRDLKPSNVLIDPNDQPRVTDFGLAKRFDVAADVRRLTPPDAPHSALNAPAESQSLLTSAATPMEFDSITVTGQVLGSPNYMSPEQAMAKRGKLGRTTDVYSLGAILFHLLTGRPPFMAETATETIQLVLEQTAINPRRLVAGVPADLETICLKCLEKEPAKRYPTAQALADELGRFLNGEPIQARPVSRAERLWRWCRRKPVIATLSAATAMLLLLVAIGSPIAAYRINHARQLAEARAYASDMKITQIALDADNLGRAEGLLRRYLPPSSQSVQRDFAWRYLWQATRGEAKRSFQHPASVSCAVLSPDGRWLATASFGAQVRVWNLAEGRVIAEFPGIWFDGLWNLSLAFTSDGQHLIVTHAEREANRVLVVEVGSWMVQRELPFLGGALAAAARSPTLVVFHGDLELNVSNVRKPTLMVFDTRDWSSFALPYPVDVTNIGNPSLTISDDGRWVAASNSGDQRRVWCWDAAARKYLREIPSAYLVYTLAMSPDGRRLAIGALDGSVVLRNTQTGELLAEAKVPGDRLYCVAFAPDGRVLAGASGRQLLVLWDVVDQPDGSVALRARPARRGHHRGIWSVAFSRDGSTLVTASEDGTVKTWDAEPPLRRRVVIPRPADSFTEFSRDGGALWTFTPGVALEYWNLTNGLPIQRLEIPRESERRRPLPMKSGRLLVGTAEGSLIVWDAAARREEHRWQVGAGVVVPEALSADETRAVLWVGIEKGVLWNLSRAEVEADLAEGLTTFDEQAAFSPDGRWLAYTSTNYVIRLWDTQARRLTPFAARHPSFVGTIAFSPDRRRLLTGCWDGTARIWNVASSREEAALVSSHMIAVERVSYSPELRNLFTGSRDHSFVWLVQTGQEMLAFNESRGVPFAVSFDGTWFLTRAPDSPEAIEVHSLPMLEQIDAALSREP